MTPTMQWQDIRYAPKNGTKIDLWFRSSSVPGGFRIADCFWSSKHCRFMVRCPRANAIVPAEMHAEDDKKKRELVEARNQADALIYSTEKSIKELGDKVDSETKSKVEARRFHE